MADESAIVPVGRPLPRPSGFQSDMMTPGETQAFLTDLVRAIEDELDELRAAVAVLHDNQP